MTGSARSQPMFENRHDAGRQLAVELREYRDRPVVVLAIPNGGVPIALEGAGVLKAVLTSSFPARFPCP